MGPKSKRQIVPMVSFLNCIFNFPSHFLASGCFDILFLSGNTSFIGTDALAIQRGCMLDTSDSCDEKTG